MRYAILCYFFLLMTACQNEERFVYYPNGNIKAEKTFKDGKLNGLYKEYYEDGKLKTTGYYVNGLRENIFYTYHENNKLVGVYNYKEGRKNDTCFDFHPFGPIKFINVYVMDSLISQELIDTANNYRISYLNNDHIIDFYENSKVKCIETGFNFSQNLFKIEFDSTGRVFNIINTNNLKMLTKEDSLDLDRSYPDWKKQISDWGKLKK